MTDCDNQVFFLSTAAAKKNALYLRRANSITVPIGNVNVTLKQTGRLGVTGEHQAGGEPKRQTLEVTTGTN